MGILSVNREKCNLCSICVNVCPFGAIEVKNEKVEINAACKVCKICLKKCPNTAITIIDEQRRQIDKSEWKGIMVFVEQMESEIHPVTFELIGKARQLAGIVNHPVYCIFIGSNISDKAKELLNYGADRIFIYDYEQLKHFRVDLYANAFENCIKKVKPSIILTGATSTGRSLAPRVAARFRTGLTADCTALDIRSDTDLIQIRPAFGGNIMAQIATPHSRPQFATVRYRVMERADYVENPSGTIEKCSLNEEQLNSEINIIKVEHKERKPDISEAEVLVVAGRGVKEPEDMAMLEELALLLNGQLAVTRPLVEAGWAAYTKQIGLSGRTVKPKLIITCGVSGAIQFTASMSTSECIFAINKDKNAQIFKVAHYGIVGDLYQIVPSLIEKIKKEENEVCIIKR